MFLSPIMDKIFVSSDYCNAWGLSVIYLFCLLFLFFHKFRKNSLHPPLNISNNNNPEIRVLKLPHFGHFTGTDAAVQFNSMSTPMNSCPQSLHLYLYIPLSIVRYDLCVINVIYIGMARTPYLYTLRELVYILIDSVGRLKTGIPENPATPP